MQFRQRLTSKWKALTQREKPDIVDEDQLSPVRDPFRQKQPQPVPILSSHFEGPTDPSTQPVTSPNGAPRCNTNVYERPLPQLPQSDDLRERWQQMSNRHYIDDFPVKDSPPVAEISLHDFVRTAPTPQFGSETVLRVIEQMGQLAADLHYVHEAVRVTPPYAKLEERGRVLTHFRHAYLKPRNILLNTSRNVRKVGDFIMTDRVRREDRDRLPVLTGTYPFSDGDPTETWQDVLATCTQRGRMCYLSACDDIVALGIVFLEIVLWMFGHQAGLQRMKVPSEDDSTAFGSPPISFWRVEVSYRSWYEVYWFDIYQMLRHQAQHDRDILAIVDVIGSMFRSNPDRYAHPFHITQKLSQIRDYMNIQINRFGNIPHSMCLAYTTPSCPYCSNPAMPNKIRDTFNNNHNRKTRPIFTRSGRLLTVCVDHKPDANTVLGYDPRYDPSRDPRVRYRELRHSSSNSLHLAMVLYDPAFAERVMRESGVPIDDC